MKKLMVAAAIALGLSLCLSLLVVATWAEPAEKRIALVIGNAAYQTGPLVTTANDAGLVAQTLQAAGFDVAGARDLDEESLRHAVRDFIDKVTAAGPDAVAFVYFAGYGLQLEGENFLVPIDARIERDSDVPVRGLRVYDFIVRALASVKPKASFVVLDAARANQFARSGQPLAGGLALIEPPPGMLVAFNAAPGTVSPEGQGPYGAYAQALAEMMREGGLPVAEAFDRVRLRVNEITKGAEVPWSAAKALPPFVFFERTADAPPLAMPPEQVAAIRSQPIRELGAQEGYAAALDRDTVGAYDEFITAYPDDPLARRARAILAIRREAIVWRRTCVVDTPDAYWSYLERYPKGPHSFDARRRLARLAAALEPPAVFAALAYDEPPPPPEEIFYVNRPVLVFDDPVFAFPPPPPPPVFLLPPPPPEFVLLLAPPPPIGLFVLPIPVYLPVPIWVVPPVYVAPPPPNNIIFTNVHNTVVINQTTNTVNITTPSGQPVLPPAVASAPQPGASPQPPGTAAAAAPAIGPSLPPSVAQRASLIQGPAGPNAPLAAPATQTSPGQTRQSAMPRPTNTLPGGQPLPGAGGQPLPPGASAVDRTPGKPGQPSQTTSGQPLPGAAGRQPLPPSASATPGQPGPGGTPAGRTLPGPGAKPVPRVPGHALPKPGPQPGMPVGSNSVPAPAQATATAPNTGATPPRGQSQPAFHPSQQPPPAPPPRAAQPPGAPPQAMHPPGPPPGPPPQAMHPPGPPPGAPPQAMHPPGPPPGPPPQAMRPAAPPPATRAGQPPCPPGTHWAGGRCI